MIYQANSSNSKIDVLNELGLRTGEILSRKQIHLLGKIHRAVHIYLFDNENNLLIQRRSSNVDHCPNKFGISVTGHIGARESSQNAAIRELKEELGINIDLGVKFIFSYRQDENISPCYIDRQFNDVYICKYNFKLDDIAFNKNEISEIKLVAISKFEEMMNENVIVPYYKKAFEDIKYFISSEKY